MPLLSAVPSISMSVDGVTWSIVADRCSPRNRLTLTARLKNRSNASDSDTGMRDGLDQRSALKPLSNHARPHERSS